MSLRGKTLIIICLTLAVLLVLLYVTSRIILLNSFLSLEDQRVREDAQRVVNTVADEQVDLDRTLSDWSNWDDSYTFVQDGNKDFITKNSSPDVTADIKVNLMIFVNTAGQSVFSKAYDTQNRQEAPLPQGLNSLLASGSPLLKLPNEQSKASGLILASGTPMLVASRPILTSDKKGPSHGTLIFGRYLNQLEVQQISDKLRQSVGAYSVGDPKLPADYAAAQSKLASASDSVVVQPLSDDTIAGYVLLQDIFGKPAVVLRTDMPRDTLKQGLTSLSLFLGFLLIAGLVFAGVVLVTLERVVLSPVANLSRAVSAIRTGGDINSRLRVQGDDELASLGDNINSMLETLDQSQQTMAESNQRLRTIVNNAPIVVWALDAKGIFVLVDGTGFKTLGVDPQGLIGKTIFEVSKTLPQLEEGNRRALSGEKVVSNISIAKQKFETRYTPLLDGTGTVISVVGVATDITERAQAELDLQLARGRLEQRNQQLEKSGQLFSSTLQQLVELIRQNASQSELLKCLDRVRAELDQLNA